LKLLEARLRLSEMVREWRSYAKRVAEAARALVGPCEVYVFGSVASGLATGASDVDILVVCSQLPKGCRGRGELKARIEEAAGLPLYHPFEIHLATDEEARENPVYRSAIKEGVAF
jgi:predicted nucleotidyltransferase